MDDLSLMAQKSYQGTSLNTKLLKFSWEREGRETLTHFVSVD